MKRILLLIFILFYAFFYARGQIEISGIVTSDKDKSPLPGVNVIVKGTTLGTTTDPNGYYLITVPDTVQELEFSYIGYLSETQTVSLERGNSQKINILLIEDILQLDDVVVIGYGTQKKSLVTGAISKVSSDELYKNQTRIERSLQGKTSGVRVVQESGSPGSSLTMRIRGTSSNRNSNPLFIVDGMRTSGMEYLNPNDIESVEVLKDAASAAIYGAEGANGVVLVTTKSGKKGESEINYSFNYGIQKPVNIPEVMDAKQYATYYRDGLRHEIESQYVGFEIPDVLLNRLLDKSYPFNPDTLDSGTNWMNEIFHPAPVQEHSLSVFGGNDKTTAFVSGSYLDQQGIVGSDKADFKRFTTRVNLDHKAKDWLDIGSRISFTHFKRTDIAENNEFGGVISNAMNLDPLTPVYYSDTSQFPAKYKQQIYSNFSDLNISSLRAPDNKGYYGMSQYVQNEISNPVAQIDNDHGRWYTDKLVGGIYAKISPYKGFSLKSTYDIDLAYGNFKEWVPRYYYHSVNFNLTSRTRQSTYRWFTWQWENVASYNTKIEDHNITGMLGMTMRDYTYYYLSGLGEVLQEESWNFAMLDAVLSDSTKKASDGNNSEERLLSYFGRIQYNYKEIIMFDASLRCDGSSKLGGDNKFLYFPSLSLGWIVSNQDFWNFTPVNFAKIRVSWGRNGSIQSVKNFEYVSTITSNSAASYYLSGGNKLTGAEPEQISNEALVWESTQQMDAGIDLRFLNNRLGFSTDVYRKKTIDLITTAAMPEYVGNNKPSANAGVVTNTGIEFELDYKGNAGGFKYDLSANAAYNKNKVTSLSQGSNNLTGANLGTTGAITRSEVDKPIWFLYGYYAEDIFDSWDEINAYVNHQGELIQPAAIPGDVKFKDVNGDGTITEDDKIMIGSPHPDWIFGFSSKVEFRNIYLAFFFQGSLGNEVYYGAYRTDLNKNNKPEFFYENAWTEENHTDWPRYTVTDNNTNFSHNSLFVFDGSYLRLQNLELGYSLPANVLERVKIKNLRIYISGNNLFVLTKYPGGDPEVGNSIMENGGDSKYGTSIGVDRGLYPRARVYSFGINMTL